MSFFYLSGEKIEPGDLITYGGSAGHIAVIAEAGDLEPAIAWYVREGGAGLMLMTDAMGAVYTNRADEDLPFGSRCAQSLR